MEFISFFSFLYGGEIIKICPNCGKENRDKSFCTGCGFDIRDVETEEERIKREEQEQQLELERKEREQKQKQLEIERKEREQKEKQLELERKEREQKQKQFEIERKQRQEKENKKRKQKSNLKIIGVLIIIIAVLCAGLYFVINLNSNQLISDSIGSDVNTVDEDVNSKHVNTDDVEFKAVDFNGLFTMNLPKEYTLQVVENPNLNAKYAWHILNGLSTYSHVYYYDGYKDLNDILSKFPAHNIEREGNLVLFKSDGNYYVGVESNNNEFIVMSATNNVNDLDDYKQSANSIVFK